MISIADESIHIQTSSEVQFATLSWLGEVALVASHLHKQGLVNKIIICGTPTEKRKAWSSFRPFFSPLHLPL